MVKPWLLFCGLLISSASFAADGSFQVMSYNIKRGVGALAPEPGPAMQSHARIITEKLTSGRALVGFQEAIQGKLQFNEIPYLISQLPPPWVSFFGKTMDENGYEFGNANLTNFPIEKGPLQVAFAFDKTSTCRADLKKAPTPININDRCDFGTEPRSATAIKVLIDDQKLWFVNTHLDYYPGIALRRQLFELLGFVKSFSAVYPVIITGDFNIPPRHQAELEQIMASAGFKLAAKRNVDFIFYSDPTTKLELTGSDTVFKSSDLLGSDLSDHEPIIANFVLKQDDRLCKGITQTVGDANQPSGSATVEFSRTTGKLELKLVEDLKSATYQFACDRTIRSSTADKVLRTCRLIDTPDLSELNLLGTSAIVDASSDFTGELRGTVTKGTRTLRVSMNCRMQNTLFP